MKAIVFISLILVATVSAAMAAETHMTIQTNTTIRIDPATGNIKGDAQTQIQGIKIEPDPAASPAATPAADTSSTGTGTGTTPTTGATSADSSIATTAATGASSSDTAPASTTATGESSSTTPCPTCPLTQATAGQSN